ncbi:MAG: hypothetical protein PQJ58_07420 [Spirochaetales bacterium]|nr:hypothetical protein [Spirochaetales bacterium]
MQKTSEPFPEKPLGYVKEGLSRMGQEVSHVYSDLVFPDHSAYLIQFGSESHELNLYFNEECPGSERSRLKNQLIEQLAGGIGFSLNFAGDFSMVQEADEQIRLNFLPG